MPNPPWMCLTSAVGTSVPRSPFPNTPSFIQCEANWAAKSFKHYKSPSGQSFKNDFVRTPKWNKEWGTVKVDNLGFRKLICFLKNCIFSKQLQFSESNPVLKCLIQSQKVGFKKSISKNKHHFEKLQLFQTNLVLEEKLSSEDEFVLHRVNLFSRNLQVLRKLMYSLKNNSIFNRLIIFSK